MFRKLFLAGAVCAFCAGCEVNNPEQFPVENASPVYFTLEDVARLLASVPLGAEQMAEVHDAVASSGLNGYDNEYLMRDVFGNPGAGIGDKTTKAAHAYATPLRELLRQAASATKGGGAFPQALIDSLAVSDTQIYWPYPENWDGISMPVVTFDPGGDAATNFGYTLDGEKILVDEQLAMERPVWVVSNNSDAGFTSLEMLRREDPSWGQGGSIVVTPRAASGDIKTLVLRSFKTYRQFDSWFGGASEFFVKLGSVEDFCASTEAELRLYQPSITDFMIVVRRNQIEQEVPFNAILVSEWTKDLSNCALMITEDDGGTRTTWKCTALVRVNSKSYGVEIELPLNSRDDIVWRGALSRKYIEKYSGETARFGDIDLVFELI